MTAMIAVGLTFVILTAEIDLSVAAIANATAIVLTFFTAAARLRQHRQYAVAGGAGSVIVLVLAACCGLGLITAVGVTRIGIPSFIMTLAMMQIGAGISAVLVRGQIAYTVPSLVQTLGSKAIYGIPWIVIVAAAMLAVAHFVLSYTRFGRYVYMVGGNREAAEYSGVNVRFVVGAVMTISAVCSGMAGMLGVAYFRQRAAERVRHVPARRDRGGGGWRHKPVLAAVAARGHDCRPVRARRAQQRPRLCEDRQLPEDPDPGRHSAGRAGHQHLGRASEKRRAK